MNQIIITENSLRKSNLTYISEALVDLFSHVDAKLNIKNGKIRSELTLRYNSDYHEIVLTEVADKIADVIAINYKYKYLKKGISVGGLSTNDKEVLLVALISADLEEDKKYIIKKLKSFNEYCIDGIFNFRMKPLKQKWNEILSYIPTTFGVSGLKEFISYLIKDKVGVKVYYENGKLYDKYYRELNRVNLIGEYDILTAMKEILLSGAGEVELETALPPLDDKYVKEFYEGNLHYGAGYLSGN